MTWALINPDNTWAGGPYAAKPVPTNGKRVIEVALGFPDLAYWSPEHGAWVDYLSQDQCLALVDAQAGALRAAYVTMASGMADIYRRKMTEVAALNTLGGSAAQILLALRALTPAQQQATYPFLYAEMQAAGLADLTVARDHVVAASNASAAPLAAIERCRRSAKIAVRSATTIAAKNLAATTVAWPS